MKDYTQIWWDVRPHPRFGTIEVRAMDAVSRVDDAVALAAYVQALVRMHIAAEESGDPADACHSVLTHENKWRAARYGLQATVVDPAGGGPIPVVALIERTLDGLAPHARDLGCDSELDGVRRILREGNAADRQLSIHSATADTVQVTRDVVEMTRAG